ncbi:hypothetical protein QTP88_011952 [Uroleucon formosanum]
MPIPQWVYNLHHKKRKGNLRFVLPYGESNQDNSTLQQSDSFRINTFTVILDSLITELNKRKNAYDTVNIKFGFLFNLTKLPLSKVREQATQLQQNYPEDLGSSFFNECIHFRGYLYELQENNLPITVLDLNKIVKDPNISDIFERQNGKKKLAFKKYMYVVHKVCLNFIRRKCCKKNNHKCPCISKTSQDKKRLIKIDHEHNHLSCQNEIDAAKIKMQIKRRTKITKSRPA